MDFSAYGRRLSAIHESVKAFCAETGRYYDYTTTVRFAPGADPREQYEQYAWRCATAPLRSAGQWKQPTHPASELSAQSPAVGSAAATGTVVVGQPPKDPGFEEMFGPGLSSRWNRHGSGDPICLIFCRD